MRASSRETCSIPFPPGMAETEWSGLCEDESLGSSDSLSTALPMRGAVRRAPDEPV